MLTTKRKILGRINFFQKMIAIITSFSLMLAMAPSNSVVLAGGGSGENFVTKAKPNHWGRSDLRAYLNGLNKSDNNTAMPLDSTTSANSSSGYCSYFVKDEYDLVQPFTYCTNKLNTSVVATSVYETTDKFWLPSGNYSSNQVLSWGSEDISANTQYTATKEYDSQRIIPISYWCQGKGGIAWARSPYYFIGCCAL